MAEIGIGKSQITILIKQLGRYYEKAEETIRIITRCALVAGAANVVGGVIPGVAVVTTIISCVGAVWTMYVKLCQELKISLSEKALKLLARAVVSNIAANLGGALVAMLAAMLLPVGSVAASALVGFVTVYLAGIVFLKLILKLAEKTGDPHSFNGIDANSMKREVADFKVTQEDLEEAKKVFDENRDKPEK